MKVLMVGVDKKRVGGMWTVANNYISNIEYNNAVDLTYIPTSTNGSIFIRVLCMLLGYFKILLVLFMKKIDLVHIHMAEKGSTFRKGVVAKVCKKFNKKVIIHMHAGPFMSWYGSLSLKKQKKIIKIFSCADKILVLGEYWKKELSSIIETNKIIVLYNGVKCPKLNPYTNKSNNIVYFGVMRKEKGTYNLLESIKIIEDKIPKKIKLLLFGYDLDGGIQQKINELDLNDRVKIMGWVSSDEVKKVLLDSLIDVLPSYYEGLSMTIIEGASYGIPVITTNISTMPEILGTDYKYMIKPGDIDTLANYILELINSDRIRQKISNYEYNRVTKIYSEEKFIENTLEVYKNVMNEK